jgi:hypothetical protein
VSRTGQVSRVRGVCPRWQIEYELDDNAQTLRQVWSFRGDEAVHGETMGEAHRLLGGNTLRNYGEGQRVREVTPEGEVAWALTWPGGGLLWELGRTSPLEDLYAFAPRGVGHGEVRRTAWGPTDRVERTARR